MNKLLGLTTFLVIVLVLIAFSNSHTVLRANATTKYFAERRNASQIKAIGCAPDKQFFPTPPGSEEIFTNDNKRSAGILKDGILTIELEAREGMWFPETHEGEPIRVYAFAEKGKPLQLPGPGIRVPEGTIIKASIQNKLDTAMTLHGFCSRPAVAGDSIIIHLVQHMKQHLKPGNRVLIFIGRQPVIRSVFSDWCFLILQIASYSALLLLILLIKSRTPKKGS